MYVASQEALAARALIAIMNARPPLCVDEWLHIANHWSSSSCQEWTTSPHLPAIVYDMYGSIETVLPEG